MTNPLVTLRGLRHAYQEGRQERYVLRGINLEIKEGECIALLGRSGSGKSTLLNLISGIDLPASGEVWINGVNLTRMNERQRTLFRRRHIGFVYQFFNLIPTLTVEENLLLPLDLNQMYDGAALSRALSLLAQTGLMERRSSFPDQLSGGEQQRLAIARALVHQPMLVLADEPTGNLDAETGDQVLTLLEMQVRQQGKTLILVTHSRTVAQLADEVWQLENGALVHA